MIANLPTPGRTRIPMGHRCRLRHYRFGHLRLEWSRPSKTGALDGAGRPGRNREIAFARYREFLFFGYIVVLAAMSMLRFPEAVLVGIATAVVQCYWRPAKRPTGIQVRFNLFNYAISAAASWYAFHGLKTLAPEMDLAPCFVLGACTFFVINSGLVSWIVGILSGRRPFEVWETSHLPIFPYYLFGAGCAAILGWRTQLSAWLLLAMLPLLALLYESMRLRVRKAS